MRCKHLVQATLSLTALCTLAACGGSDGGVNSASSLSADAASRAVADLSRSGSADTMGVTLSGTFTDPRDVPSGVAASQSSGFGSGITLSYDADTRSYTIQLDQGGISESMTYRPQDRDTTPDRAGFIEFERDAAGGDDTDLLLRIPGAGNSNLSHVSYGIWNRETDLPGDADRERWAMFVFGQRTAAGDLPVSGTARYSGSVDGLWTSATASYRLSGSAQLLADFGAGSVSGTLDISGRDRETGTSVAMDRLAGTAALDRAGATFAGSVTGEQGFAGNWNGAFFGPGAAEVGGTFAVTRGGEQAVGVFTAGR